MQKQKYQAYTAATQTVARTKQIVMLYDGAIRFMKQAKEATGKKHVEERYHALTKASTIITGLQLCLDFENGGHIAKILNNFYTSIDARIFSVHRSGSAATCDEVIEELRKMRDTWHEIDAKESEDSAPKTMSEVAAPVIPAAPVAVAPPTQAPLTGETERGITLSA